jgi:hypothetical protein
VTWEPGTGKIFEELVVVRARFICAQRLVQGIINLFRI